jgi:organic hydroperoxide reductase OsmC/OhrA
VVLHPQVELADPEDVALLPRLHEEAHAACFVASSVNFPVRVAPVPA